MPDAAHDGDRERDTGGMRAAFWAWALLVIGGLAVMIALPLMGR
ncbi:hypothetical protein [Microbacterium album]|nr:hypothetical protein [Microbacterium album]